MLYITGDTHGDIERIKKASRKLKKGDSLFVTGDFGFIWYGSDLEKKILKQLGKKNYNIIFADGEHENFDELTKYTLVQFANGKAVQISGNLYYAIRGEIYSFNNFSSMKNKKNNEKDDGVENSEETVFVFGGDVNRAAEEYNDPSNGYPFPNEEDEKRALKNLETCGFKVDYIVTYEAPSNIADSLEAGTHINYPLDVFAEKIEFKRWFFGKYHISKPIGNHHFAMFDKILPFFADANNFIGKQHKKKKIKVR